MKTLADIMIEGFVTSVGRHATVAEACAAMGESNAGIVAIEDDGHLVGLFSERDVVRRVVNEGENPATTPVENVMTTKIVVAAPTDDVESAVRKMDSANIRHLPVVEDGHLVSMLSIRDLMRVNLHERDEEIHYLYEYMYLVQH